MRYIGTIICGILGGLLGNALSKHDWFAFTLALIAWILSLIYDIYNYIKEDSK